jgi:arabinogalactan oligomer / maltooligosaccharide transport system substrate-binding protein
MKERKTLVVLLAAAVATALGVAASASPSKASVATKGGVHKGATITIWDYFISAPKERATLNRVAQQWAKKTGNKVVNPGDVQDSINKFKIAARTGRGPDLIQIPHDNTGQLAAPGLLAPQPKGFVISRGLYTKTGLQAFTFNSRLWGLPIATESYFLFYNKRLIKKAPKTWNGLIAQAKRLTHGDQYGFLWDTTNFYYDYAIIRGYGGYVFKVTKKGYDQNKLGIATVGGIRGLAFIQDLVQKHKLTPPTTSTNIMEGKFNNGQAAMIIDGPWAVQGFKSKGVNFGVSPLPRLPNGQPSKPFIGMQGFVVNKRSKHMKEAWDLLRYLSIHLPLPLYQASGRVPVLKAAANSRAVRRNAVANAVMTSSRNGEPMPNIPAMGVVWEPMADALAQLVQGKTTPAAAARAAQQRIAQRISELGG